MIHAEDHFGFRILELVVEFFGGVNRVAVDSHGTGFQYPEKHLRKMGDVGKENRHLVPFFDAVGSQKMGDPVCRVLDLGIGSGGAVENGMGVALLHNS
jgi:hypothetical protein